MNIRSLGEIRLREQTNVLVLYTARAFTLI